MCNITTIIKTKIVFQTILSKDTENDQTNCYFGIMFLPMFDDSFGNDLYYNDTAFLFFIFTLNCVLACKLVNHFCTVSWIHLNLLILLSTLMNYHNLQEYITTMLNYLIMSWWVPCETHYIHKEMTFTSSVKRQLFFNRCVC